MKKIIFTLVRMFIFVAGITLFSCIVAGIAMVPIISIISIFTFFRVESWIPIIYCLALFGWFFYGFWTD